MQKNIANKVFEFRDEILKKQAHEISKIHKRKELGELDDMDLMDEILKVLIKSIDSESDTSKYQEIFDNMTVEDYNLLVSEGSQLFDPVKKNENSNTSMKPFSTDEVETSQKNG